MDEDERVARLPNVGKRTLGGELFVFGHKPSESRCASRVHIGRSGERLWTEVRKGRAKVLIAVVDDKSRFSRG